MSSLNSLVTLKSQKPEVRLLVLRTLTSEWPLSAKEIYRRISANTTSAATYQAVHKSLSQLLNNGVVVRGKTDFSICITWIEEVAAFAQELKYHYSDKRNLAINMPTGHKAFISTNLLSMLTRLLLEKNLKLKDYSWFLYENRVGITPLSMIVDVSRRCRENKLTSLVYLAGKRGGYEWIKSGLTHGSVSHNATEEILHAGDMLSFAGWGKMYVEEYDNKDRELSLVVENAVEALEHQRLFSKSKLPVCDFIRGVFAGGFSVALHEPTLEFVEIKCKARGSTNCHFEGRPRKGFSNQKEFIRQVGRKSERTDLAFLSSSKLDDYNGGPISNE